MAHTPSPWIACNYHVDDANGKMIARMCSPGSNDDDYMLIAAAPKLLAALRQLVERYDAIRGVPGLSMVDGDFDAARAAIAESCVEVTA